jgi:hypothetical protein
MGRKEKTYVVVQPGKSIIKNSKQETVEPGNPVVSGDQIFMVQSDYDKLLGSSLDKLPFPYDTKSELI